MKKGIAYLSLLLLTSISFLSTPISSHAEEQKRSFWKRMFGSDDSTVKKGIQTDATARSRVSGTTKGSSHPEDDATATDTRNRESDREAAQHKRRLEHEKLEEAEKQAELERRREKEARKELERQKEREDEAAKQTERESRKEREARKERQEEAAKQAEREEEARKQRQKAEENDQGDDDDQGEDKAKKNKDKGGKNSKPLPSGLQKKLDRGGELPPGWQKKQN